MMKPGSLAMVKNILTFKFVFDGLTLFYRRQQAVLQQLHRGASAPNVVTHCTHSLLQGQIMIYSMRNYQFFPGYIRVQVCLRSSTVHLVPPVNPGSHILYSDDAKFMSIKFGTFTKDQGNRSIPSSED